jgi:hypothetical protein
VKNIAFVKTENALVLGDIQESDVIQVSKYFNNTLGMFQKNFCSSRLWKTKAFKTYGVT